MLTPAGLECSYALCYSQRELFKIEIGEIVCSCACLKALKPCWRIDFILNMKPLKDASGMNVEDIAKRLMDFGFKSPTVSFPVAGTLMIEPTESEPKAELDRFIEAMTVIRKEIQNIVDGISDKKDNTSSSLRRTRLLPSQARPGRMHIRAFRRLFPCRDWKSKILAAGWTSQ